MDVGRFFLRLAPRPEGQKGGIGTMPLRKNVPKPRNGWKLTKCPKCGRECWRTISKKEQEEMQTELMCTECALMAELTK
jgi:hypothetical protein